MKNKKMTLNEAFKELGEIDKLYESGKYTKKQHDAKSKSVLKRLMKSPK